MLSNNGGKSFVGANLRTNNTIRMLIYNIEPFGVFAVKEKGFNVEGIRS